MSDLTSSSEYQKIKGEIARVGVLLEATNAGDNMAVIQLVGYQSMTIRTTRFSNCVDVAPPSPESIAFSLSKSGDIVEIYVNARNQATTQGFKNLTMEQGLEVSRPSKSMSLP